MNTKPSKHTGVAPWDDFRLRERPLLHKLTPYRCWSRWGTRHRRAIDGSGMVKADGHYLVPGTYGLGAIDVVISRDGEILLIRPGTDEVVGRYRHYEKGVPDALEGFKHAKDEYRTPGELTAEAQLKREMGKFEGYGEATREYVARYVKFRFQKYKRLVAQQLAFLHRHAEKYDPAVVEGACSHALEMNDFDKSNFVIYLSAWEKLSKKSRRRPQKRQALQQGGLPAVKG